MTRFRQVALAALILTGGATVLRAQQGGTDERYCCYTSFGAECCGAHSCAAGFLTCSAS